MLLKEAKEILKDNGFTLEKKEQLDESVLTIAGGVALGLLALKVVGKIVGFGLTGLLSLLMEDNHKASLIKMIIEQNKAEIADEIKDKLMENPEVIDAIEKGQFSKETVKNSIQQELRGLIAKYYNSKALQNTYDQWHDRDFNVIKKTKIIDALTDIVYEAMKDIQIEQA